MGDGLSDSPILHLVGAETWAAMQPRVRSALEAMADGSSGRYLADDLEHSITGGEFLLWTVFDGTDLVCTCLTQLLVYPRARAMRLIGLVGRNPFRWTALLHDIERAAVQHWGCTMMEAMTQPRHAALMRTRGWQVSHWFSEKALTV